MDAVLFFDVTDEEILGPAGTAPERSRAAPTTTPPRWPPGSRPTASRPRRCSHWYEQRGGVPPHPGRRHGRRDRRDECAQALGGSMITLKSPREIEIMARAGRIVAGTLALMREIVRPGHDDRGSRRGRRARSSAATTAPRRRSRASTAFPRRSAPRSTTRSCTAFPSAERVLAEGQHRERRRGRAARGSPRRLGHHHSGGRDHAGGGAAAGR